MPAIVAVRGHHRMVSCRNGRSMLSPNVCTSTQSSLTCLKCVVTLSFTLKMGTPMTQSKRLLILLNQTRASVGSAAGCCMTGKTTASVNKAISNFTVFRCEEMVSAAPFLCSPPVVYDCLLCTHTYILCEKEGCLMYRTTACATIAPSDS